MKTCFDQIQILQCKLLDISHTHLVPDPMPKLLSRKEYLINELINTANQLRDEFPEVEYHLPVLIGSNATGWVNILEEDMELKNFIGVDN